MNKDDLINEILAQLVVLRDLSDKIKTTTEAISFFDLQFRLKCKLYELTEELKQAKRAAASGS